MGRQPPVLGIGTPHHLPHRHRLGNPLGHDVPGSGKGLLGRWNGIIEEFSRLDGRILHLAGKHSRSQRLQPLFLGNGGTGAPLGAVRQIKVLQRHWVKTLPDPLLKLRSQLLLRGNGLQDRHLALLQFLEFRAVVLDFSHLGLIQASGTLLAVTGYEGHGRPFGYQFDTVLHPPGRNGHKFRDMIDIQTFHKVNIFTNIRNFPEQNMR